MHPISFFFTVFIYIYIYIYIHIYLLEDRIPPKESLITPAASNLIIMNNIKNFRAPRSLAPAPPPSPRGPGGGEGATFPDTLSRQPFVFHNLFFDLNTFLQHLFDLNISKPHLSILIFSNNTFQSYSLPPAIFDLNIFQSQIIFYFQTTTKFFNLPNKKSDRHFPKQHFNIIPIGFCGEDLICVKTLPISIDQGSMPTRQQHKVLPLLVDYQINDGLW